ncbi:MAG: exonuclease subunit SbcD [Aquificae bacterium]|nr:exonuclease subunit SbcD [Aquificota bacterium]
MRLLHLSDLHAGKTLGRVSRNEDLRYALDQVVDLCRNEKPDYVLVAGDVFDKPNPDNEAKEIIFDFFLRLYDLKIPSVVISGNHDSYEFMKSLRNLLRVINVFVVPRPRPEECVLDFGELKIACLPYPSERVITAASEDSKLTYAKAVEKVIRYLFSLVQEARYRVFLSHLFVAGSLYTRTEREATISEFYAVPPAAIPSEFSYVALGHVHRYQRVKGVSSEAYYTGSLFQLDFSESGHDKFVNLVELREDQPPRVEAIKLDLKNPLHEYTLSQTEILNRLGELKSTSGYLKVKIEVKDRGGLPLVVDRLKEQLGERLVRIELLEREKRAEKLPDTGRMDVLDLYREYHKSVHGKDPSEAVMKTFAELLDRVRSS